MRGLDQEDIVVRELDQEDIVAWELGQEDIVEGLDQGIAEIVKHSGVVAHLPGLEFDFGRLWDWRFVWAIGILVRMDPVCDTPPPHFAPVLAWRYAAGLLFADEGG